MAAYHPKLIFLMLLLISCTQREAGEAPENGPGPARQYATGFSMEQYHGLSVLRVQDPWQGSEGVAFRYVLAGEGREIPDSLSHLPVIRVPVERIICMSTTHVAMVTALGRAGTIVGVSGRDYITDAWLRERIGRGEVADVGADGGLDYERIVSLDPDVMVAYGIGGEISGTVNRLRDLGIPVILNGDYLEGHPLGKLEWIRCMGALYREGAVADSIFRNIEGEYLATRDLAGEVDARPTVMTGLPWKGSWYLPGGNSFAAAFIRDAGAEFLWGDGDRREALPYSIESIFARASTADYWINTGSAGSLSDIRGTDERLALFLPFREGRVYNNTARLQPAGGNDYWEQGVMEPHIILADLVSIFHPGLLPGHELVYYRKLQ